MKNIVIVKYSNQLAHHGVQGMHWGEWNAETAARYNRKPGDPGTFLGQNRSQDIRFKKGTTAYRLQLGPDLGKGQKYVSIKKGSDHKAYLEATIAGEGGLTVPIWDDNKNAFVDKQLTSLKLKLTQDIIAPSYHETMDSFIKTFRDKKVAKNFVKESQDRGLMPKEKAKDFLKGVSHYKKSEALEKAYMVFASQMMNDSQARSNFIKDLRSKGYNAIIDEIDYQYGKGFTESPTIIFDDSAVKVTGKRSYSSKELSTLNKISNNAGYYTNKQEEQIDKAIDKWIGNTESKRRMIGKS